MADYVLEGEKWGSPTFGTTGGTVTWAVDGSIPASFVPVIAAAFAKWSAVANISFVQVASTATASIDFDVHALDGRNNALGVTNYSFSGAAFRSAAVTFDSAEGWTQSGGTVVTSSGIDLLLVAAHEIGHAIGLDHYNAVPAVMNSILNPAVTGLTQSDIHGILAIYGPAAPTSSLDALVDDGFYYAVNADIQAAAIDPDQHYAQAGWREGRDPDAFFSTVGYLGANPDVARAGLNPVQHYDTSGWREGRDPSARFDNELYLERYGDVRAAGVDPLAHFLATGQAEGRQVFQAVGRAADFTHGSFDAEFYLLANPDVARAALNAGGDTFVFAYQHFHASGWREGRDPNAAFDTKGYLATYADVRNAGIDPLAHYDTNGWQEGRDPSTHFDTTQYRAVYGDVAAAGVNPLQHYLTMGIHEGRAPFDDGIWG